MGSSDNTDVALAITTEAEAEPVSNKKKWRKDKPWDHEGINHWKEEEFTKEQSSGPFLEESSFATLFPQYREKYLREVWRGVVAALDNVGVAAELNLVEGSMTVRTTRKTWDPIAILCARDLIKLLARSVPLPQAVKVLRDDVHCDIVKIGTFVHNKERFVKRRQRLIGPNGSTLKAIELLTESYILVQGNTVSCMGSHKGLKQARRIIEDCMRNVHPVYNIKTLMIKRELAKDPQLKNENWDRFLPKFKKRNVKKRKSSGPTKTRKEYTPFPPLPTPSKIDLQLESGEYFMNEGERKRKSREEKRAKREQMESEKAAEKEKEFIPPVEDECPEKAGRGRQRKRKRAAVEAGVQITSAVSGEEVSALAEKVRKKAKKDKKAKKKAEKA